MRTTLHHIIVFTVFLLAASCGERKTTAHSTHETAEKAVYTCPMHPEIIRDAPGSCPICGMDLVKKETGSAAVDDAGLGALLRPANAFVISSVPVTTMFSRKEETGWDVTGTVAYDTRQFGTIASRVSGRIEKLFVRYRYQRVARGQRIMDIYSPELLTAQENLLFLLRNDPGNTSLIDAARDRLLLLGMSPAQVRTVGQTRRTIFAVPVFSRYDGFVTDQPGNNETTGDMNTPGTQAQQELFVREGTYVQAGQAVFTVYDPSKAWILLDIFPEQQAVVRVGDPVRITPESAPARYFRSTIAYVEPVFRADSKTMTARVYFNNAKLQLPVGSRVTAHITGRSLSGNWLPKEAVLSLGRDQIVFKKEGDGFRAQAISTSVVVNNHILVTGGLSPSDSVAVNAQFLVDNEAFIKVNNR
ncbi:MAG TPA: efflux RND transporter periplasmic adaptor subunit [Flavisolibacter sp.]